MPVYPSRGHTHDQTITWNNFNSSFEFTATSGAHNHPLGITTHTVNPTITASVSTTTGGLAETVVYLTESDVVDRVEVTNGGASYVDTDTIVFAGGSPTAPPEVQPHSVTVIRAQAGAPPRFLALPLRPDLIGKIYRL